MFDTADKTEIYLRIGRREIPAYINGTLATRRVNGITKALVYWRDDAGLDRIELYSIKSMRERVFKLEG